MNIKKYILVISLLLLTNLLISQNKNLFDSLYNEGVDKAYKDTSLGKDILFKLEKVNNLTNIQIVKLNYLKFKVGKYLKKKQNNTDKINVEIINNVDSILDEGINLIHNSYTDKGISLLFKFLELTKSDLNQANNRYFCKIYIAEGYRKKREFNKAVDLLNSVIISEDISNKNLAFAYNRLAANYNEWDNSNIKNLLDTVIKYSKLSIKISRENSFKSNLASSLNELGYIYSNKLYKYDEAEKFFIEAYQYFIEENLFKNAINTAINLSGLYLRKGDYNKALKIGEKAINICDIEGNEDAHMRLYLQLANIYSYNKMYHSAYEFLAIGRNIQEKINNNNSDKTINELAAKYDLKIKNAQINREKDIVKAEKKQTLFIIIILFSLIIILIISYVLIVFKNKNILQQKKLDIIEKEHLKSIVEIKNKELLHAIVKNNNYTTILSQIKSALNNNDNKTALNLLNQNINTESSWDNFLIKFTEIHPDFLAKLEKQFPQLTANEKKLSPLLFMNLTTKEIAKIINISENSVKKNRQRLRKKLRLPKATNISEYIKGSIK